MHLFLCWCGRKKCGQRCGVQNPFAIRAVFGFRVCRVQKPQGRSRTFRRASCGKYSKHDSQPHSGGKPIVIERVKNGGRLPLPDFPLNLCASAYQHNVFHVFGKQRALARAEKLFLALACLGFRVQRAFSYFFWFLGGGKKNDILRFSFDSGSSRALSPFSTGVI